MLDDKRLERRIRGAAKYGLTIYANGEEIAFLASDWMGRARLDTLQRKLRGTLGALAELLGFLPDAGCIHIVKGKDDYAVSYEMEDVIAEQIGTYLDPRSEPVKPSGLQLGSLYLWQDRSGRLYGQRQDRVDPDIEDVTVNGAGCMVIRDLDAGTEEYIRTTCPGRWGPAENEDYVRRWRALEAVRWTDWEQAPGEEEATGEPEEEEQTEIQEEFLEDDEE